MTALDLIKSSLRLLQVLGMDVVLPAEEANNALMTLNLLLDSWSTNALSIYQVTQEQFTLQGGHNPHTWGIGGDLNSERPQALLSANFRITPGNSDMAIVLLDFDDYSRVVLKSLQSLFPQYAYFDHAYPLANVYFNPIPQNALTIQTYSQKPLTKPATLTTELSFPPGYERALKYNLACELAPEYQVSWGDISRIAVESLAAVERQNRRLRTMQVDPALFGKRSTRFNIYRGP